MQKTADRFHDWLIKVSEIIHVKMEPATCFEKEINDHLYDSAIVNFERFLQIEYEAFPYVVTTYDQVQWVAYH